MDRVVMVPVYDKDDPDLVAIIDEDDALKVFKYDWQAKRNGKDKTTYAVSRRHIGGGSYATVRMHNVVMGEKPGKEPDHKNGNGLDNRKQNLRFVTGTEQAWNRRAKQNQKSSRFKGVTRHKPSGKWVAQICNNYKVTRIGQFDDEEDAARAYDEAARKTRGDLATFNFPQPGERSAITGEIASNGNQD